MQPHTPTDSRPVEELTQREREILAQMADGKSDREIAGRLVLSLNTVKWYAQQIYGKLSVRNRRMAVRRAQELGLLGDATPVPAPAPVPQPALPTLLTPFVGREQELQFICQVLVEGANRLVTLAGPGGIGKTRLAVQVAHALAAQAPPPFADGIYFVPLTGLQEWQLIVYTIAHVVGLDLQPGAEAPIEQLFGYTRPKQMLLVLDNFEHLISVESNHFILDLLTQAPRLSILITSRSQLKLYGEQVYPLSGLELPDPSALRQQADPLTVTRGYSALRLFDQCARQLRPSFRLNDTSLGAMMRICQAVEGMPLAIEMAAGWIEVLNIEEIATEVERSLQQLDAATLGIPERQRSLWSVCDSSWRLLTVPERETMQQLSVFGGGFERAAAEAITGVTPKTLLSLVSKSWLRRGNDNRFEIHELLRQYSAERLAQDPLVEADTRDRHSAYYCRWLSRHEAALRGAGQRAAVAAIAADLANVVAGCRWAARHHSDRLAEATTVLGSFLRLAGDIQTGIRLLVELLDALPSAEQGGLARGWEEAQQVAANNLLARARLLTQLSELRSMLGETEASTHEIEQALALLDLPVLSAVDTRRERAHLVVQQGYNNYMSRPDVAVKHFTEGYALYQALDDREQMAAAQIGLGRAYRTAGAIEQAREVLQESLAYYEKSGNVISQSEALGALSSIAILQTRFAEAERYIRQSLALIPETDRHRQAYVLGLLGSTQYNQGLLAEAEATLELAIRIQLEDGNEWLATANMMRLNHVLLNQGRYEDALEQVDAIQTIIRKRTQKTMVHGIIEYLHPWKYGSVALAQGRYAEAQRDLAQALAAWRPVAYSRYERSEIIGCLVLALRALGRRSEAWANLADGLHDALQVRSYLGLLLAIAGSALRELDEGNIARALELYTTVATQPLVAHSIWYADVAGKEIVAAASRLPADVAAQARRKGEAADLWETSEMLAGLVPDDDR